MRPSCWPQRSLVEIALGLPGAYQGLLGDFVGGIQRISTVQLRQVLRSYCEAAVSHVRCYVRQHVFGIFTTQKHESQALLQTHLSNPFDMKKTIHTDSLEVHATC